ncbi:MAG: dienelactone hydrolase family protein [Bacteroidaceae bacterium]|nr:dienelactone hydrolase family protein [Bacteroidaceae bacterium]MBP3832482.1 dienelactone hydrolase family protein [Bacteroidaceae bacterium]
MNKILITLVMVIAGWMNIQAQTRNSVVMDGGGSGPYKAVMTDDESLPGFTIYRPGDIQSASKVEGALPVVLFGNGGCYRSSQPYAKFLTEIASYGYVLMAVGEWRIEHDPDEAKVWELDDEKSTLKTNDAKSLVNTALNWLEKENQRAGSEFYQTVNTHNVAAMGYSCGGIQALIMGTLGDKRIKTVVGMNTGAFIDGGPLNGMITKDDLQKLTTPIIYMLGGEKDDAAPNGRDDFKRINHVPVVLATYPSVGHTATYQDHQGGAFGQMARTWLDYQLKGKKQYENLFRYSDKGNDFEGWEITQKGFDKMQTMRLYNEIMPDNEVVKTNDIGEVVNYEKVTDPTLTISLPDADKANGTAVIICPGGALISLSWQSEFQDIARWLNARGIAAIGLKYRLRNGFPDMSKVDTTKGMPRRITVTEFAEIKNANANPSVLKGGDPEIDNALNDALKAMEIVKAHAKEWGIDESKIGFMGYSAGGGVAVNATVKAGPELMPAFLCSLYGPALDDVVVPKNAPKLFIGVHADHPSVAAGCLALFMEWKKAGVDAELHIYGDKTGGLFGGAGPQADKNTPNGAWQEAFYSWLVANGFTKKN